MQWRAAFQRDLDKGLPTVRDLSPCAWVDVYPDEILRVADARPYTGALGLENPISRGRASSVLDQMAEGWGSMTVKPDQQVVPSPLHSVVAAGEPDGIACPFGVRRVLGGARR